MPSSADHYVARRLVRLASEIPRPSRGFWPSIVRIVILEIVLLLVLAGAVVFYLNWSSDVAFAEFLAASQMPAASGLLLHPAKDYAPCQRGA